MHFFQGIPVFNLLLVCSLSVAVMASRPGGLGSEKPADAEIQKIADSVRSGVEENLGQQPAQYKAVSYKSQIVSGINYFVKIQVDANDFVVARIYKGFSGDPELHGVQPSAANNSIEFF